MRQLLLPVRREPAAVFHQCVGVAGQRQRDHVGIQAVDDRAGLLAGAAMRLFDGDVLTGGGFPVFGESGVVFDVEFTCGVVGDIEQGHGRLGGWRLGHGGER